MSGELEAAMEAEVTRLQRRNRGEPEPIAPAGGTGERKRASGSSDAGRGEATPGLEDMSVGAHLAAIRRHINDQED